MTCSLLSSNGGRSVALDALCVAASVTCWFSSAMLRDAFSTAALDLATSATEEGKASSGVCVFAFGF